MSTPQENKHQLRELATEALRVWEQAGFAVKVCRASKAPVCVPSWPEPKRTPLAKLLQRRMG